MSATLSLCYRELIRFYRQRSRIIGSLGTPIIFWILLGGGLQVAFPSTGQQQGQGFVSYFFPANLILTILFTSIFSNISLIEDRNEGFLQSVLVSPVNYHSIIFGKVGGGALIAFIQGILFLLLAPLAGIAYTFSLFFYSLVAILLVAFALSTLGFIFAWKLDSVQGFHGIMNLVLMPMWLLSGAFFPIDKAPFWLKPIMYLNPLSSGFSALRISLMETVGITYWINLAVHFGFGLLFYLIAVILIRRDSGSTPRN